MDMLFNFFVNHFYFQLKQQQNVVIYVLYKIQTNVQHSIMNVDQQYHIQLMHNVNL